MHHQLRFSVWSYCVRFVRPSVTISETFESLWLRFKSWLHPTVSTWKSWQSWYWFTQLQPFFGGLLEPQPKPELWLMVSSKQIQNYFGVKIQFVKIIFNCKNYNLYFRGKSEIILTQTEFEFLCKTNIIWIFAPKS